MRLRSKFFFSFFAVAVLFSVTPKAFADSQEAIIPFRIDDDGMWDVRMRVDDQSARSFEASPMITRFEERVEPAIVAQLRSRVVRDLDGTGWLSIDAMSRAGVQPEWDEASLTLKIAVPAVFRKSNAISISRAFIPISGETWYPSPFSVFVNANAGQDFLQRSQTSVSGGRQPLRLELDGATNARGWVLEGAGSYTERTQDAWKRGDFRLVKDDPGKMIRYSAGDVIYPIQSGFQRYRPLGGLSVSSDFNLQPYQVTTPISSYVLILKSRSIVKVWMNGRLLQTLDLPAGKHDIRDLPFSLGVNDVDLEITDDVGRTERVKVPYVYSDRLLGKGIQELSYSAGFPYSQADASRKYDTSRPTLSVSHRIGISDQFNFGGFAQGDHIQSVVGLNTAWTGVVGNFTLEPAWSHFASSAGNGYGLRLGYLYADYAGVRETQRLLGLAVEAKGPRFAALGDTRDDQYATYDVSASYSQLLFDRTSLSLTGTSRFKPAQSPEALQSRTLSAGLSRRWADNLDTSLTFTHYRDRTPFVKNTAFLLLTWSFPEKGHFITATGTTDQDAARVQWNYSPVSNTAGSWNTQVGVERNNSERKADAQIEYSGNRTRAVVSHEAEFISAERPQQRTQLRAGTALVFARGKLGLSRPVTDSFILISPEGALKEALNKDGRAEKILINAREDGGYESSTDWLGPAVSPEIVSYRYQQLQISTDRVADATVLPRENFVVLPTYKSGTVLAIGREKIIQAMGFLKSAKGMALPLWSGEIRAVGDATREAIVLFTNREGRFMLEGVRPGRYQIQNFNESTPAGELVIPEQAEGMYDLGAVRLHE